MSHMGVLGEWYEHEHGLGELKNNSTSLLKIALDSASLVAEPQPFLVKTQISELSGDSVSWTGWDSEIVEIDESWGDSASWIALWEF